MKYVLNPMSIYELGQRANQEDSIFPQSGKATVNDRLFIVCDGMGGHDSGEIASQTVCEAMSKRILSHSLLEEVPFTGEQFNEALNAAYDQLDKKDNGAAKKMGTTMTLVKFHSEGCLLAHIGDSRIYHIRPSEKYIFHTRDHSLVNDLYDIGEITLEEIKTSKQKNVITRAMQPNLDKRPKADIKQITDIRPGDYFFMCSDGMLEEMEDDNLLNILSDRESSDEEKLQILIKVSENNHDNHSAYLIHVLDVIGEGNQSVSKEKKDILPKVINSSSDSRKGKSYSPPKKKLLKTISIILFLALLFLIIYLAAMFFFQKKNPEKKRNDEAINAQKEIAKHLFHENKEESNYQMKV